MSMKATAAISAEKDEEYDRFEQLVAQQVANASGPIFKTDAPEDELWDAYLSGIPADRRQHYNCHCCRRFIQAYGGLVTINADGVESPLLWDFDAPAFFSESASRLHAVASHAKVNGVFLSASKIIGTPVNGGWNHLSATVSRSYTNIAKTASEAMAEKKEDYGILCRGLSEFTPDMVSQALRVLKADALDRSEKTIGVAEWLAALQAKISDNKGRSKSNLIWYAVATAPPGFCHIRSTMIATLLEDIASGMDFDAISSRWAAKMHPLRYQRPIAPPSDGNIAQAEKLVEKLGVTNSLKRRYATLQDVLATEWLPRQENASKATGGGVFGHLKRSGKPVQAIELPATRITWDKFKRAVLPEAFSLEVHVPHSGSFYGLVTASDPESPAIIQWDGLEGIPRNPVSWYFYSGPSYASAWNVSPGWAKVNAVFLNPPHWQSDKFKHQANMAFFAIEGCRDTNPNRAGLALFPEILKSEFHGIRSVIEAHSRMGGIDGPELGTANGLAFSANAAITVRVKPSGGLASYLIDRFD